MRLRATVSARRLAYAIEEQRVLRSNVYSRTTFARKDRASQRRGILSIELLALMVAIFFAIFTQSLTGFGSALISMPLLVALLGIQIAAPLVALVGLISEAMLMIRYRAALNTRLVWRLVIASLPGIPLGVLALAWLDEEIMTAVLGIIVLAYAAYAIFGRRPPQLRWPGWAYGAGFLAGILGGAYNTSGPPVILYGDSQRWPRDEFKGNLQGFFLINSMLVAGGHAWRQNLTPTVWQYLLISLLPIALGLWAGLALDKRLNALVFRKLVLALLVVLGISLLL